MSKKQPRSNFSIRRWLIPMFLVGGLAIGLGIWLAHKHLNTQTANSPPSQTYTPLELAHSSQKGVRVLFIGNSFTFYNDLPSLVQQLAEAAKEDVPFMGVMYAPGGYTLQQHWDSSQVQAFLQEISWNYVVLQEQSQGPSFDREIRNQRMNPYIRRFYNRIKPKEAQILLYETWGYRDGDLLNLNEDSFNAMSQRLQQGYREIANELSLPVVPVGQAWEMAIQRKPNLDLWEADGRHPSLKGSYLAACVFYAVLYNKSPVGNPFTANLEKSEAQFLQIMAAIATNK